MTVIDLVSKLESVAEELQASNAGAARAIQEVGSAIVRLLPPLTSDQAAEQLGITRPTVHEWTARRVLDRHPDSTDRQLLVTAESVSALDPEIRRWREAGGTRQALRQILDQMGTDVDRALRERVSRDPGVIPMGFGALPPVGRRSARTAERSAKTE